MSNFGLWNWVQPVFWDELQRHPNGFGMFITTVGFQNHGDIAKIEDIDGVWYESKNTNSGIWFKQQHLDLSNSNGNLTKMAI
jgi:hypothetical protein